MTDEMTCPVCGEGRLVRVTGNFYRCSGGDTECPAKNPPRTIEDINELAERTRSAEETERARAAGDVSAAAATQPAGGRVTRPGPNPKCPACGKKTKVSPDARRYADEYGGLARNYLVCEKCKNEWKKVGNKWFLLSIKKTGDPAIDLKLYKKTRRARRPKKDFKIVPTPKVSMRWGQTMNVKVNVQPEGKFDENVKLILKTPTSQFPGIHFEFAPGAAILGKPPFETLIRVNVTSNAAPGPYTINIEGISDSGIARTAEFTVIVESAKREVSGELGLRGKLKIEQEEKPSKPGTIWGIAKVKGVSVLGVKGKILRKYNVTILETGQKSSPPSTGLGKFNNFAYKFENIPAETEFSLKAITEGRKYVQTKTVTLKSGETKRVDFEFEKKEEEEEEPKRKGIKIGKWKIPPCLFYMFGGMVVSAVLGSQLLFFAALAGLIWCIIPSSEFIGSSKELMKQAREEKDPLRKENLLKVAKLQLDVMRHAKGNISNTAGVGSSIAKEVFKILGLLFLGLELVWGPTSSFPFMKIIGVIAFFVMYFMIGGHGTIKEETNA